MIVRTCLLISDDPDDHIEFSEALYEIASDAVLMTVSDVQKAVQVLILKKCTPEYVFLNVGMPGLTLDEFFSALNHDATLTNITIIAFGDNIDRDSINTSRITTFIDEGLSFSELKNELRKVIGMPGPASSSP